MNEKRTKGDWIRSISFKGLLNILKYLADFPDGLLVQKLNRAIIDNGLYLTKKGDAPSDTTLFHCRNILLKLDALYKDGNLIKLNKKNPNVKGLVKKSSHAVDKLDIHAKKYFASLIFDNDDCRKYFFDLFMRKNTTYNVKDFRDHGEPVIWYRPREKKHSKEVSLMDLQMKRLGVLQSPSEINAILYGIRYWVRDELDIIDEIFVPKKGLAMFPIKLYEKKNIFKDLANNIISDIKHEEEWTTFSIHELIMTYGVKEHNSIKEIFRAVNWLEKYYSGYVVLISTSRNFATLTSRSFQREELELRGYYRDSMRRYISHIRLHNSIREADHAQ